MATTQRKLSSASTASTSSLRQHVPDFEPDDEWKANMRKTIHEALKVMFDEADQNLNQQIKTARDDQERQRLVAEHTRTRKEITGLAQEEFEHAVNKERMQRRWTVGQALPTVISEALRSEQQTILDQIQNDKSAEPQPNDDESLPELPVHAPPEIWTPPMSPEEDALQETPYMLSKLTRRNSSTSLKSSNTGSLGIRPPTSHNPIPEFVEEPEDDSAFKSRQEAIRTQQADQQWAPVNRAREKGKEKEIERQGSVNEQQNTRTPSPLGSTTLNPPPLVLATKPAYRPQEPSQSLLSQSRPTGDVYRGPPVTPIRHNGPAEMHQGPPVTSNGSNEMHQGPPPQSNRHSGSNEMYQSLPLQSNGSNEMPQGPPPQSNRHSGSNEMYQGLPLQSNRHSGSNEMHQGPPPLSNRHSGSTEMHQGPLQSNRHSGPSYMPDHFGPPLDTGSRHSGPSEIYPVQSNRHNGSNYMADQYGPPALETGSPNGSYDEHHHFYSPSSYEPVSYHGPPPGPGYHHYGRPPYVPEVPYYAPPPPRPIYRGPYAEPEHYEGYYPMPHMNGRPVSSPRHSPVDPRLVPAARRGSTSDYPYASPPDRWHHTPPQPQAWQTWATPPDARPPPEHFPEEEEENTDDEEDQEEEDDEALLEPESASEKDRTRALRDDAARKEEEARAKEEEDIARRKEEAKAREEAIRLREQEAKEEARKALEVQAEIKLKTEEAERRHEEAKRQEKAAKRKEQEIKQKEREAKKKEDEIKRKEEEARRKEEEIRRQTEESRRKAAETARKEEEIRQKEEELKRREQELLRKESEMETRRKEEERAKKKAEKAKQDEEARQAERRRKEQEEEERREELRRKEQEEERKREELDAAWKEKERRQKDEDAKRRQESDAAKEKEDKRKKDEQAQAEFFKREQDIHRRHYEDIRQRQDSFGSDTVWSSASANYSSTSSTSSKASASTGASTPQRSATSPTWTSWAGTPNSNSNSIPARSSSQSTTSTPTAKPRTPVYASPSPVPDMEEFQRRQEKIAREQQEKFRQEQERMERERLQKAGTMMTKEDVLRLFDAHGRMWSQMRTQSELKWDSFPWPTIKKPSSPEEISYHAVNAYIFSPYYPEKDKADKDRLKEHIRKWHPDRFDTQWLPSVVQRDKTLVKEGAGQVVRYLNEMLSKSNSSNSFL